MKAVQDCTGFIFSTFHMIVYFQMIGYHEKRISRGYIYCKFCLKLPLKRRPKNDFQDQLSLNAGRKYCRMPTLEHSAILSTFIKLPLRSFFFLFIFEWQLKTGFAVLICRISSFYQYDTHCEIFLYLLSLFRN